MLCSTFKKLYRPPRWLYCAVLRDLGALITRHLSILSVPRQPNQPIAKLLRSHASKGTINGMTSTLDPLTTAKHSALVYVVAGSSPLVLDSPHSGTRYPADFAYACALSALRTAEDTHVEKLYDFAPGLGASWVEAYFPRSYLDTNRNTTEMDVTLLDAPWPHAVATDPKILAKVRLGKGLIWRATDEGVPIYTRPLSVAEVQARIENCWQPYHAAVKNAIDAAGTRIATTQSSSASAEARTSQTQPRQVQPHVPSLTASANAEAK